MLNVDKLLTLSDTDPIKGAVRLNELLVDSSIGYSPTKTIFIQGQRQLCKERSPCRDKPQGGLPLYETAIVHGNKTDRKPCNGSQNVNNYFGITMATISA